MYPDKIEHGYNRIEFSDYGSPNGSLPEAGDEGSDDPTVDQQDLLNRSRSVTPATIVRYDLNRKRRKREWKE